jgi:hypothetical protein
MPGVIINFEFDEIYSREVAVCLFESCRQRPSRKVRNEENMRSCTGLGLKPSEEQISKN